MKTPPLPADFSHASPCKPFCEKSLTLPGLWRDNKFLAAKRISLTRALAAELLEKGRVHLDEIYSQRMDKYYPGDLILHDNGERATYYLSFRGGKKEK